MLERNEILEYIESESAAAAATITSTQLDARVPSCPDWSLTQLIWHLGRVQRFWARAVHAGDVDPQFPDENESGPDEADALGEWFRASTRDLLDALQTVRWDSPAWTWWIEDRTVGAIARHQVQEAAVHRWDAQLAAGSADPLPAKLAADGVDEFLLLARQLRGPEPIAFHATDAGQTFSAGGDAPVTTVSATASDLVLLLYSRVGADAVEVAGDRAALDAFLVPIG